MEALSPKLSDTTPAFVSVKKGTNIFYSSGTKYLFRLLSLFIYLFLCYLGASGLVKSKEYTHADLLQHESFWFAKNVIEKKYFEC